MEMEIYLNKSGTSQITHYLIQEDRIIIKFKSNKLYSYSYNKAGIFHVEHMKTLAKNGNGLSAYITHNVKFSYD